MEENNWKLENFAVEEMKDEPGYYRTYIPQYSALTNRLNRIKKAEKFM